MSETTMTAKEKRKVATKVMDKINKDQGRIAIGFASEVAKKLTFIPTPSEEVNVMLGGGFPVGRITEIFGSNSSGKTSILLETIGEEMAENPDSIWGWLESEESFDPEYVDSVHDVDLDRLILIDVAEEGAENSLDRMEALMRTGILTGFGVNSVAGLTPKAEMDEDIGKQSIALQARMMSKLMRKWTGLIGRQGITAVFINQLRTDVGARFGDPNVTTGGRALSFYASTRFGMNTLKLQDSDPINAEEGLKISARVAKNRCVYDNPYKKCEFYVIYGTGVDKLYEIMENAPEAGIMRKSGSWFYYEQEDGEQINAATAMMNGVLEKDVPIKFQGKGKFREFLSENPWFVEQMRQEIRGKVAKGELMPKFQNEEELKDIEKLSEIEKEIEKEMAEAEKPKAKKKKPAADKKPKPEDKAKKKADTKKPAADKAKKEARTKELERTPKEDAEK